VINVHGRVSRTFREAGTERSSSVFSDIELFLSRNPITAIIVIRIKTATLM
jgi:hypothetical protein